MKYTHELANYILSELVNGSTLTSICSEHGKLTHYDVYRWGMENEIFAKRYWNAREKQVRLYGRMALELLDI